MLAVSPSTLHIVCRQLLEAICLAHGMMRFGVFPGQEFSSYWGTRCRHEGFGFSDRLREHNCDIYQVIEWSFELCYLLTSVTRSCHKRSSMMFNVVDRVCASLGDSAQVRMTSFIVTRIHAFAISIFVRFDFDYHLDQFWLVHSTLSPSSFRITFNIVRHYYLTS